MESNDIINNNILIAEFLEFKKHGEMYGINADHPQESIFRDYNTGSFTDDEGNIFYGYMPVDMPFYFSWDWLMLAVEKIECLGYSFNINSVTTATIPLANIFINGTSNKIHSVYEAVIKFIIQYNVQKNNLTAKI